MDVNELARAKHQPSFCRHPWETARLNVALNILKKHIPFPVQHIIDLGSGDGFVIQEMFLKKLSKEYTAVDIGYNNPLIKEEVVKTLDAQINITPQFNLASVSHQQGKTLFLLMDVLEHLEKEQILLDPLPKAGVQSESYLLITVPAHASLFSSHDVLLGHYRRYNQQTVLDLCHQYQFQPLETGYFFFSLWAIRWCRVFLEKIFKTKKERSIENWQHHPWMTAIVTKTLMADYKLSCIFKSLGIHLPGLSVYCLCKI